MIDLRHGSNLDVLPTLADNSVDSIVTDPPYELGFMGKSWDASGIAYSVQLWRECLRVLKPGGHLLAFSGSRTYHRMTCAIEDAGFEVRDQIMWVYGSGFPKSLDVSKAIDKAAGAERAVVGREENWGASKAADGKAAFGDYAGGWDITAPATAAAQQWQGWGTALKPAHEPICVARKPLIGTVAANVLAHGTGALNIDLCRVAIDPDADASQLRTMQRGQRVEDTSGQKWGLSKTGGDVPQVIRLDGRWPANLIHDGSEEVTERMGEPARFFYCAKASKRDRDDGLEGFEEKPANSTYGDGLNTDSKVRTDAQALNGVARDGRRNIHPTVKPTDLMRYLCRLVTPPGGVVLDPFTGSGSTGKAAVLEGFRFIGIELSAEYLAVAEARIKAANDNQPQSSLFEGAA